MSRVIHKYALALADEVTVEEPSLARWRVVGMQQGHLYAWAEVDPTRPTVGYLFHIYGTGHPLRSDAQTYLGSVFDPIGLVWHIYLDSDYA